MATADTANRETPAATGADHIAVVAQACGGLAIGCVEAVDAITGTAAGVARQMQNLIAMETILAGLETRQQDAAQASGKARALSATARRRLDDGSALIDGAIGEFEALTDLVARMGVQVTAFAAAMEQVRHVAASIEGITRTTRMLALNAAIEAKRAGSSGATFAVVADEVKKLAQDTRVAVDEIGRTVASLDQEAAAIVGDIGAGIAQATGARRAFGGVHDALADVRDIVGEVDAHNAGIAEAASSIHADAIGVRVELASFASEARAADGLLGSAREKVDGIELLASGMFDTIVQSGLAVDDQVFVDRAVAAARDVATLVDHAIARGDITAAAVFDRDYIPIKGSDPARFDNRFADFADAHLRPILDRVAARSDRIRSVVCSDAGGYLPTHNSLYSHTPRADDPAWNNAHCRNRRIILDAATRRAIDSDAPFMMAVYRFDRGGKPDFLRNVWVPIVIGGRRWGNFEIAYSGPE